MARILFAKRPVYVAWFGILGSLCVYAALIMSLSMHSKRVPAPPHETARAAGRVSPRSTSPEPLTERAQLLDAARWFGMGDDDELGFAADNFAAAAPDIPKSDSLGEVRGVTVSPRGEIRSAGTAAIPRGVAYRYILVGPGAEHIFIELGTRKDGTREFGYGPYRE